MSVRVRFAPAPSGSLHVGGALTCLFNWLYARRHGGAFVLRIEDTHAERVTAESMAGILRDLRWLGLDWDEGPEVGGPHAPYVQTERFDGYRAAARRLLDNGAAYPCYCTPDELEARRRVAQAEHRTPGYDGRCRTLSDAERATFESEGRRSALRFRVPDGETVLSDLVHGTTRFDHAGIADFVVLRADDAPTYYLAAAVDDQEMGITHVLRGEDLFSATPRQVLLYGALGYERLPSFGHWPLIVGSDRRPLSKRHGDVSVDAYRRIGILPEVLLNYLAILNWSVGDGKTERFTLDELADAFDLSGVTRNPSAFDLQKLEAMNGERIRDLPLDEFVLRLESFLEHQGVLDPTADTDATLLAIAPHIQERMRRLDETWPQVRFLFADAEPDERAAASLTAERAPLIEGALDIVEKVEPWSAAPLHDALMSWADSSGVKRKEALQPIRAAVTGSLVSPPLFESIEVLGRERTLARLRRAVERARGT